MYGNDFQIRDDYIDYIDNEKEIGKPPFRDFMQKKRRLPIILGWKRYTQHEKDILARLSSRQNLNAVQKRQVLSIILKDEVIRDSKKIVQRLRKDALSALRIFPENSSLFFTVS